MSATVLVLRTCAADMSSRNGFIWPESGPVECPDWSPEPVCGHGLHGALWGEGNAQLLSWDKDARWLVVRVLAPDIVDLDGKVKFPRGWVEHCGTRESATQYLSDHGGRGRAIIGLTATGGHDSTLTGGDGSTLTGGNRSTLTGGNRSTLTGGYRSTLTGGDGSQIRIEWWDGARTRLVVGHVGEDGLEPDVAYTVRDGALVRAEVSP